MEGNGPQHLLIDMDSAYVWIIRISSTIDHIFRYSAICCIFNYGQRTDPVWHLAAVWLVMIDAQNSHCDTQRDRTDDHHKQEINTCNRRQR